MEKDSLSAPQLIWGAEPWPDLEMLPEMHLSEERLVRPLDLSEQLKPEKS
jgi:hypothetical protein